MDYEEQQMEDQWIERQIDEELDTLNELQADLNEQQRSVYKQMSAGKSMAKEHIAIIRTILGGHNYEGKTNV